jgi:hypothetical protein
LHCRQTDFEDGKTRTEATLGGLDNLSGTCGMGSTSYPEEERKTGWAPEGRARRRLFKGVIRKFGTLFINPEIRNRIP